MRTSRRTANRDLPRCTLPLEWATWSRLGCCWAPASTSTSGHSPILKTVQDKDRGEPARREAPLESDAAARPEAQAQVDSARAETRTSAAARRCSSPISEEHTSEL